MYIRVWRSVILLCLLTAAGFGLAGAALPALSADSAEGPPASETEGSRQSLYSTPQRIEQAFERGEIDEEQRLLYLAFALGDYERLPKELRGNAPWSGTMALLELEQALTDSTASLAPETAETIAGVASGSCASSTANLALVFDSSHFHIEYNTVGGGLTIDDYAAALEETWKKEIDEFGWAAPPVNVANPPPGNRYHVRVEPLGDPNLLGYVSWLGYYAGPVGNNPNTPWDDANAYASCLTLSNDYSGRAQPAPAMLQGTAAHEFNHSIQYGYGVMFGQHRPDPVFIEGGPTWIVDEVFDDSDAGNSYLWPEIDKCMGAYPGNPYGYWITFRGLTERYGVGEAGGGEQVMQDFWELTSQSSSSNMLSALDSALANKGSSLAGAFHEYAISLRFTKACPTAAPFCFEEADAYVNAAGGIKDSGFIKEVGGAYDGELQDNYAINYIELPYEGRYAVAFENHSAGGEFRVSMLADMGGELQVTSFPSLIGGNEQVVLENYEVPQGAITVVAVITNQAQTADNPSSCTAHPYTLRLQAVEVAEADLLVSQEDQADPVHPGGDVIYTIEVMNAGPDQASDVVVSDTLPANTTFVADGSSCQLQGAVVQCSLGELAVNATKSVAITVKSPNNQAAALVNQVEVSAAQHDPNSANNVSIEHTDLRWLIHLPMVEGS